MPFIWDKDSKSYKAVASNRPAKKTTRKYTMHADCYHCKNMYAFEFNTKSEIQAYSEKGWPCPHCGKSQRLDD